MVGGAGAGETAAPGGTAEGPVSSVRPPPAVSPPTVLPSHLRTSNGIGAGGREVDELAGTIAARATELREVQGKGARAQKKRALAALVEALQTAGVSRLRSAVPATERSVQAWFRQVRPLSVLSAWDR